MDPFARQRLGRSDVMLPRLGMGGAGLGNLFDKISEAQAQATLGPEWNVAYSRHHRVAWIARESSKPRRALTERWTVQASPAWSAQHLDDDDERVAAKLGKAFAELTGIRAEPGEARIWRCAEARTLRPLGRSHLWDAHTGLGLAGDWCIGHRVEDAFLSGLELALGLLAAAPRG